MKIDLKGVPIVVEGDKTPFVKTEDSLSLITDKSVFPIEEIEKGTKITVTGVTLEFRF